MSFTAALASFASAAIPGVSSLIDTLGNMRNVDKTNQTNKDIANQNLQFQNENLQYQKDLQKQIFAREDNAVQRRVDDLVAAGLSPTLAAGSAANAGQAIETQALHNGYSPQTMPNLGLSSMIGAGLDALRAIGELNKQQAEISYLQDQSKNVQADTANKLIFGNNADDWYKARTYGLQLKNVNQGFSNEILEKTKNNQILAQDYKTKILNNELYFSDWDTMYNKKFGIQPSKLYGSQWGLPLLTANNAVGLALPNVLSNTKDNISGFMQALGDLGAEIYGYGKDTLGKVKGFFGGKRK